MTPESDCPASFESSVIIDSFSSFSDAITDNFFINVFTVFTLGVACVAMLVENCENLREQMWV